MEGFEPKKLALLRILQILKENNIQITTVKAYTWNELD